MPTQLQPNNFTLAYQSVIERLQLLVERVSVEESNVMLLTLFGSVARLEPHVGSDTDVLAIFNKPQPFKIPEQLGIIGILVDVEKEHGLQLYDWPISVVISEELGDDLDPDFLACVRRDGVLLYQREGIECPPALRGLPSFDNWLKRAGIVFTELALSDKAPK